MSASPKWPVYGHEPRATNRGAVWSRWDLWFCVVALVDHDGDLDALGEAIQNGGWSGGGGTVEAKLSHLDDLNRRMAVAGVDAQALVGDEDGDPKIRAKARAKVRGQGLSSAANLPSGVPGSGVRGSEAGIRGAAPLSPPAAARAARPG
jgi:hypothetical protein